MCCVGQLPALVELCVTMELGAATSGDRSQLLIPAGTLIVADHLETIMSPEANPRSMLGLLDKPHSPAPLCLSKARTRMPIGAVKAYFVQQYRSHNDALGDAEAAAKRRTSPCRFPARRSWTSGSCVQFATDCASITHATLIPRWLPRSNRKQQPFWVKCLPST
jgi:hypothetical protein